MVVQSFTSDYRLFLSWSDSLRGNDSLKKLPFSSSTGDFAMPNWTVLGKWLPSTEVERPDQGSLWNLFSAL